MDFVSPIIVFVVTVKRKIESTMTEAIFQTTLNKWLKLNWRELYTKSAAFELKVCKQGSMPFNRVEEHQWMALQRAKHGLVVYKIPDMSLGSKPFDTFTLQQAGGFVVILYWRETDGNVYFIDVDDFILERSNSTRKSLTDERAKAIAYLKMKYSDLRS